MGLLGEVHPVAVVAGVGGVLEVDGVEVVPEVGDALGHRPACRDRALDKVLADDQVCQDVGHLVVVLLAVRPGRGEELLEVRLDVLGKVVSGVVAGLHCLVV